jgi:hypothetical protein
MGDLRNICKILFDIPGGKRPPERQRQKWEANIKMDRKEVGC